MNSILWIGNSFTYYNDLPQMFDNIVKEEGTALKTDSVTKGGWYLHAHANPSDEYGALVQEKLKQPWDTVVLQEQSFHPIRDHSDYVESARSIIARCGDAKVYLYQSWSYQPDSDKLAKTGLNFEIMHTALKHSIRQAGEELGVPVVPVGDAVYKCVKEHPEIPLYKPDHFHPDVNLTYMAALCFYKVFFGRMPYGDYVPQGVTNAEIIRNIVRNIDL